MVLIFFLTCLAMRGVSADPSGNSSTFQLDVLFPQANGAYRRTGRFPIIFAMSGLDSIWQDKPGFEWNLRAYRLENGSYEDDPAPDDWRVWGSSLPSTNFSNSVSANMLVVDSSAAPTAPGLANITDWQLNYRLVRFSENNSSFCPVVHLQNRTATIDSQPGQGSHFEGSFNFTIKDDIPPFVFASGELCGQPLGTLETLGHAEQRQLPVQACPTISSPPPPVQECRTRLNDSGFQEIYKQLGTGEITCGNVSSTTPNLNRTLCSGVKSGAASVRFGTIWLSVSVLAMVIAYVSIIQV